MDSSPTILPQSKPRRRGRLSLAAGQELIAAWRSSSLSIEQYCHEHGHQVATLKRWVEKLSPTDAVDPPRFVEITVDVAADRIDVVTGLGAVVRVRSQFDAALLRAVVEALR
jgi:hypothetical protein